MLMWHVKKQYIEKIQCIVNDGKEDIWRIFSRKNKMCKNGVEMQEGNFANRFSSE